MRLAISNIAWPADQDEAVATLLREEGVEGIEIAPTKWWPKPLEATKEEIRDRRRFWEERGLSIVAAQSLLFGKADLQLFGSKEIRNALREYLSGVIAVCAALGAGPLVFGSPKNRRRGEITNEEAKRIAVEFFHSLAEFAHERGACLSLEANPPYYGADFMTTVAEAFEVVRAVDHPGVRLQIDTACMNYVNDDPSTLLPAVAPVISHFHVSEPNLVEIGSSSIDHSLFATKLHQIGYAGWVSIEMRSMEPFSIAGLRQAIRFVGERYFDHWRR